MFNKSCSNQKKKDLIQATFAEMDFNSQKNDRSLSTTKLLIEAWQMNRMTFSYDQNSEMNLQMQQVIRNQALIEWGKHTVAIFDEQNLYVTIQNFDGREKVFGAT